MNLLIIADDLSGAADCAIGFASAGLHTVVALDTSTDTLGAQVIAIDTDSRRLVPTDAAALTLRAFDALNRPGGRLYKKIDSTLRGNWAAEVAVLQPRAGLAIIAPAFPATGRTLREGRVLVAGAPLESTDTWRLENADREADIEAMLLGAGLTSARLDLQGLRVDPRQLAQHLLNVKESGVQALIVDSETSDDLRTLALATIDLEREVFWVGSGGLAREISALLQPGTFSAADAALAPEPSGSILVMVGSLSAVSDRQCALLKSQSGIAELLVPPAVLRAGPEHHDWRLWQACMIQALDGGSDLLLRIGRDAVFAPAEGERLCTALAAMTAPYFGQVAGLVATGGETARAMLSAAAIGGLQIHQEIEAGVVLGKPLLRAQDRCPRIVTKAGAFGSDQALYRAWQYLNQAGGNRASAHPVKASRSTL